MGVNGLWRLLMPIGRRISVETLTNKTLAIDASIWLTQFLKAMRDPNTGQTKPSAHLIGFIHRICKLLFFGIKPVFVFDGPTPEIKMREIRARRQRRERVLFGGEVIKGEDAAIKKMARRILLQQIQKSKSESNKNGQYAKEITHKHGNNSSFANDFQIDSDEEKGTKNKIYETKSMNKNAETETGTDKRAKNSNEKDDFKNDENDHTIQNDFDKPIVALDDSSESEESTSYKNTRYNRHNRYGRYRQNYHQKSNIDLPSEESDIDEDAVANMPNEERTDIFENAMRNQRLRSRQEFMPVAGDPIAYSQVQIKNFLKQSHLNQKLNRIAANKNTSTESAKKDIVADAIVPGRKKREKNDFEKGEQIASDPTKRYIYTKDSPKSEEGQNRIKSLQVSSLNKLPTSLVHRKRYEPKRRLKRKNNLEDIHSEAESDDDDQFLQTNNNKFSLTSCMNQFEEDEDDDDTENKGGDFMNIDEKVTGTNYDQNSQTKVKNSETFEDINLCEESLDEEGGFMIDEGSLSQEIKGRSTTAKLNDDHKSLEAKQILQDEMLARAIQDIDEKPSDIVCIPKISVDVDENVIQMQQSNLLNASNSNNANSDPITLKELPLFLDKDDTDDDFDEIYNSNNKHNVGKQHEDVKRKRVSENGKPLKKQKLLDFLSQFGRAHESDSDFEFEHNSNDNRVDTKQPGLNDKDKKNAVIDIDGDDGSDDNEVQQIKDEIRLNERKSNEENEGTSSDSDSEPLDWEDGSNNFEDDDRDQHENVIVENCLSKKVVQSNEPYIVKEVPTDNIHKKHNDSIFVLEGSESIHSPPEIGACQGQAQYLLSTSNTTTHTTDLKSTNGLDHSNKTVEISFDGKDSTPIFDDEAEVREIQSSHIPKKDPVNESEKSDFEKNQDGNQKYSDSTKAALLQAQKTASNLTDWAGRAVKRAFADHIDVKNQTNHFSVESSAIDLVDCDSSDEVNTQFEIAGSVNVDESSPQSSSSALDEGNSFLDKQNLSLKNNSEKNESYNNLFNATNQVIDHITEEEDLLNEEMRRHERDMATVTDEMRSEIIQLLQLFGIPFVESPSEAEAQCVALEELGLVDGIVTEDSDVFVFGGKHVYKNIFDDKKYVEVYLTDDAEKELALTKNHMVALAMLLGGDYTEGVKGVGIVNGMEILRAFPVGDGVQEGLSQFKKWLDGFDPSLDIQSLSGTDGSTGKAVSSVEKFHMKHRTARTRWIAPNDFPSSSVFNAYYKPVVDKADVKFSWGVPDLQGTRAFCQKLIGWRHEDTDKIIVPVLKEMAKGSRQTKLESYFMSYSDNVKFANVRSKRLQAVMKDIKASKEREMQNASKGSSLAEADTESKDKEEMGESGMQDEGGFQYI